MAHEPHQSKVRKLKEYFHTHYGYIALELTDNQLIEFVKQSHMSGKKIEFIANMLADYILSQDLGDVQE